MNKQNNVLCDQNISEDYKKTTPSLGSLIFGATNKISTASNNVLFTFQKILKGVENQKGGRKNRKRNRKKKRKIYFGGANPVQDNITSKTIQVIKNIIQAQKNDHNQSNSSLGAKDTSSISSVNLNVDTELLTDFIEYNLDTNTIHTLLKCYIILETLFKNTNRNIPITTNVSNIQQGVDVVFPWYTPKFYLSVADRSKCLYQHLTNSNVSNLDDDLIKNCFTCKNCTLINTTYHVWNNLFTNLFSSESSRLKKMTNDLYKHISDKITEIKYDPIQEYLLYLMSMNLVTDHLDITNQSEEYEDIINFMLGIPKMYNKQNNTIPNDAKESLRNTFNIMEKLHFRDVLYQLCFSRMFKDIINAKTKEQRLYYIKKRIQERMNNENHENDDENTNNILDNDIDLNDISDYDVSSESNNTIKMIFENNKNYKSLLTKLMGVDWYKGHNQNFQNGIDKLRRSQNANS